MSIVESTEPEWTLEEAVREVSKLRRENARLRIHLKDLKAAAGTEAAELTAGLRRLRSMLRHLQVSATEHLDSLAASGFVSEEDGE